jgi:CHAD domain-containing protein
MDTWDWMRDYALAKTSELLDDLVAALNHAAQVPDEDAVHKMRVSIRRLQQALRLFHQYLKTKGVERIRAHSKAIMEVAGELRNRDIAIGLVTEAGGDASILQQEREELNLRLKKTLEPFATPDLRLRWRLLLGLEAL